jgi:hypothetical protein
MVSEIEKFFPEDISGAQHLPTGQVVFHIFEQVWRFNGFRPGKFPQKPFSFITQRGPRSGKENLRAFLNRF